MSRIINNKPVTLDSMTEARLRSHNSASEKPIRNVTEADFADLIGTTSSVLIPASTPAVPVPHALEKQLSLKLEAQKRRYPVFVIDHIEEKPTED